MDTNERDKLEEEKGDNGNSMKYDPSSLSSNWRFMGRNPTNPPMDLVPTNDNTPVCSSYSFAPMINSFGQTLWNHLSSPGNPGFAGINVRQIMNSSKEILLSPNPHGIPPKSFHQFTDDSGFTDRAARFSCFSGGNFGMMMNSRFGVTESLMNQSPRDGGSLQGPQDGFLGNGSKLVCGGQCHKNELNVDQTLKGASPVVEHKETAVGPTKNNVKSDDHASIQEEMKPGSGNESGGAEFTGVNGPEELSSLDSVSAEPSAKNLSTKKRKKNVQSTEAGESKEGPEHKEAGKNTSEDKQKVEQKPNPNPNQTAEKNGNQGSQASDHSKEEYIHVRARRGQATNSHSLAERIRREKISERMKLLQDLVPGCNRVTGKAVLLDEIINYVQSLQRQVEFLSMKLATVIPRLDFNVEGLKETLHPRPGPSSSLPFPQDFPMSYPPSHQSQPPFLSLSHPNFNPSDVLRRSMNSEMPSLTGGFEGQLPGVWENELHNVVHMNYGASGDAHDSTGAASPGQLKGKP